MRFPTLPISIIMQGIILIFKDSLPMFEPISPISFITPSIDHQIDSITMSFIPFIDFSSICTAGFHSNCYEIFTRSIRHAFDWSVKARLHRIVVLFSTLGWLGDMTVENRAEFLLVFEVVRLIVLHNKSSWIKEFRRKFIVFQNFYFWIWWWENISGLEI